MTRTPVPVQIRRVRPAFLRAASFLASREAFLPALCGRAVAWATAGPFLAWFLRYFCVTIRSPYPRKINSSRPTARRRFCSCDVIQVSWLNTRSTPNTASDDADTAVMPRICRLTQLNNPARAQRPTR